MRFENSQSFLDWPNKAITLLGMSGVGKTSISDKMRKHNWFHYSVDYRIGTRYLEESIVDSFKAEAMKVPVLQQLLRNDSIYIASNITFNNLEPLSIYLGKPGNELKGGLAFEEYMHRQQQHKLAEMSSIQDITHFMEKSRNLYGYDHFICDTSGSLCEVVDLDNPNDPSLKALSDNTLIIYIRGNETHRDELINRFCKAPKPMYYQEGFLQQKWQEYKDLKSITSDDDIDPDDFIVWGFQELIDHRLPIYQDIANRYGYVIEADDIQNIENENDFTDLIAKAIEMQS